MEKAAREVHLYDLTAAVINVGLAHPKEVDRELKRLAAERTNQEQQPGTK
jgi:hypothetical protein